VVISGSHHLELDLEGTFSDSLSATVHKNDDRFMELTTIATYVEWIGIDDVVNGEAGFRCRVNTQVLEVEVVGAARSE
jgi:hypothetical protein